MAERGRLVWIKIDIDYSVAFELLSAFSMMARLVVVGDDKVDGVDRAMLTERC